MTIVNFGWRSKVNSAFIVKCPKTQKHSRELFEYRIKMAQELIRKGNLNKKEIAAELGITYETLRMLLLKTK